MKRGLLIGLLLMIAVPGLGAASVPVVTWRGELDYAALGFIEQQLKEAGEAGAPYLVWRLDAAGGELDAAERIAGLLRESAVPVVVWVGPYGARLTGAALLAGWAAAGLYGSREAVLGEAHSFILDAAGEVQPLDDGDAEKRDASAGRAAELAAGQGYDSRWAELLTAGYLELPVGDWERFGVGGGLVGEVGELPARLAAQHLPGPFPVDTPETAALDVRSPDILWRILPYLVNPGVAFIAFLLALLAFAFAATNPGGYLSYGAGAMLLVLALIAFDFLPISALGLVLTSGAMLLFILELLLGVKGILAIISLVTLFFGGVFFYQPGTTQVPLSVLVPALAVTGVFFVFAVGGGMAIRLRAQGSILRSLVGREGTTLTRLSERRRGKVEVGSETWLARAVTPIPRGRRVRIRGVDGSYLLVEPKEAEEE